MGVFFLKFVLFINKPGSVCKYKYSGETLQNPLLGISNWNRLCGSLPQRLLSH